MRLLTFRECKTRLPAGKIRRLFELVVDGEADPGWQGSVNLILTTDRRIRKLNREFLGKDSATDVLSFNIDDPQSRRSVFGEIYISVDTAARQARQHGASLAREYLRLIGHGLLHLFGYDHEKKRPAARMRQREDYYLSRLEEGAS
ncbi:MAG TPA: rRNA maturation RNase YbeY [Acidobacteriota bacterium]|nr:rRNA maturation RNase YbeY [Acidobacteriota bacterium]